jgi:hypothetical protein
MQIFLILSSSVAFGFFLSITMVGLYVQESSISSPMLYFHCLSQKNLRDLEHAWYACRCFLTLSVGLDEKLEARKLAQTRSLVARLGSTRYNF